MKAREPFGLKLISILPEWAISGSAYYFFFVVIVIRHETTTAARWASSLLIVRTFLNDAITVAVWTGFHSAPPCGYLRKLVSLRGYPRAGAIPG
jgi:hypothetical protein